MSELIITKRKMYEHTPKAVSRFHSFVDYTIKSDKTQVIINIPYKFDILRHIWYENSKGTLLNATFTANDLPLEEVTQAGIKLYKEFFDVEDGVIPFGFSRKHGFPVVACVYNVLQVILTFDKEQTDDLRVGLHGECLSKEVHDKLALKESFELSFPILKCMTIENQGNEYFRLSENMFDKSACFLFELVDKTDIKKVVCHFEGICRFDLSFHTLSKIIPSIHGLKSSDTAMMFSFIDTFDKYEEGELTNLGKLTSCGIEIMCNDNKRIVNKLNICSITMRTFRFSAGAVGITLDRE